MQQEPVSNSIWTIRRKRGVDRRTRGARRWAALRAGYAQRLGRQLDADEDDLLDALADVAVEREILRVHRMAGRHVDPDLVKSLSGELRRLRASLGLVGRADRADSTTSGPSGLSGLMNGGST